MEKPVFILGSHKSGTSLVRNLFDGVPGLFVIPNEIHFFQYTGYGVDYALRHAKPRKLDFDTVVGKIRRAIEHANSKPESLRKHGDSYLPGRWDVEALVDYLQQHGADAFRQGDMRALFDCYVTALYVSLYGQPPTATRFVEKSVENAEFAAVLKVLYPDARFIHVVRNPYATLVSLRKFKTRQGRYPYLGQMIDSLRNSYYYLYQNPRHVADYKIVRYEDLLTDTHAQMQALAAFTEIPFSERLLEPTTLDAAWSGNSMSGRDFQGLSTYPISAWQKDIAPHEIACVNLLFDHVLTDYDYERQPVPSGVYRPVRGEGPKTYVANRFLLQQYRNLQGIEQHGI